MSPGLRSRRVRAATAGGALCALLVAGCGGGSSSGGGDGASGTDTLVVFSGASTDFQANFNPYSPTKLEGAGTIFEPLFFLNTARQEDPVPLLGTAYDWNEDGTELSISLREGVEWSDGEEFTADDVKFTFDMLREHDAINSIGFDGETTVVDPTRVTVAFDAPAYMNVANLLGRTWIVPEHIWSDVEDPSTDTMTEPVGTGAYTLGEFKPQAFILNANPNHWDGEPAVRTVRSVALSGNQAGADALSAGEVDWLTSPVPSLDRVEEVYPGYSALVANTFQVVLGACASEELGCSGPQTDPAVRQAIFHAMHRDHINALAFQNIGAPMSPGFGLPERDYVSADLENQVTPMESDVDQATAILEAAGWQRDGDVYEKDGERLAISVRVVSGWTDYIATLQTLTEQLAEAGIELTVDQSSWNEWSDAKSRGDYELIIDSLSPGPTADPYWQYTYFFSEINTAPVGETANTNFARYVDADVERAVEELSHLDPTDERARQPHLDVIQTTVERDMPYIPVLLNGTVSVWQSEKFTGWPAEDDLYAFPALWQSPDSSQILKNLRPADGT
ncbi:ABC transporter substrate-binding protein [Streptomyces profundus]|uniref:ABC transporter substrate-binding protein n=1 Tax=Streptomyces profundus TaxID=2867410 RepID=UPI001D1660F5|nr:ABC transporter substrate-binding protein [Streptomyces sp. MA3_2.13]UED87882.1 ABC transporter substrate-binding protein [Streptomyces sp. MA3_2.13]